MNNEYCDAIMPAVKQNNGTKWSWTRRNANYMKYSVNMHLVLKCVILFSGLKFDCSCIVYLNGKIAHDNDRIDKRLLQSSKFILSCNVVFKATDIQIRFLFYGNFCFHRWFDKMCRENWKTNQSFTICMPLRKSENNSWNAFNSIKTAVTGWISQNYLYVNRTRITLQIKALYKW